MYAWVVVALSGVGLVSRAGSLTPFDIAIQLLSLPGFLGLFGYAYARPVLRLRIWRTWAWLQPLVDAAATIAGFLGIGAFALPELDVGSGVGLSVGVALSVPQYVALFRYGYRSQALWERPGS